MDYADFVNILQIKTKLQTITMKAQNNTTTDYADKYGDLLTLTKAAEILDRSVECLRISLYRNDPFWSNLKKTRVRIGRRIHFRTNDFFNVVMNSQAD